MTPIRQLFDRMRVINAAGPVSRLGGAPVAAEVAEAMAAAASACIPIDRLQAAASEVISSATGAEAGMVTTGASAGLTLAAAACICGGDFALMDRLPDTAGLANEIVVARSHRNGYDHAYRAAGARLVEVGVAERTRDPQTWEIAAAIGPETVAVAFADGFSPLPLEAVVDVASRHNVPVIVDAAAALPPKRNLRRFIDAGAALVTFSGGKALGGPAGSGILCGRRDLIASAALQSLDMDDSAEVWQPPAELFVADLFRDGVPNHGIGRGMKVGKEQIVGLLTALERYLASDEGELFARCRADVQTIAQGLQSDDAVNVCVEDQDDSLPRLRLTVDAGRLGRTA
ncbi:MAG: aminotransferase class V-fold PLP-dependent enzyme, partial [Planctomycetales bacterium]|nr:aminotransferase class V-fold PLP-dependent enzyme [Planctomycetales bacterium]